MKTIKYYSVYNDCQGTGEKEPPFPDFLKEKFKYKYDLFGLKKMQIITYGSREFIASINVLKNFRNIITTKK